MPISATALAAAQSPLTTTVPESAVAVTGADDSMASASNDRSPRACMFCVADAAPTRRTPPVTTVQEYAVTASQSGWLLQLDKPPVPQSLPLVRSVKSSVVSRQPMTGAVPCVAVTHSVTVLVDGLPEVSSGTELLLDLEEEGTLHGLDVLVRCFGNSELDKLSELEARVQAEMAA